MTQPQNPGQPYIPPASAASAPGSYSQPYTQQAPYPAGAQPAFQQQAYDPNAPQAAPQQYPVATDSFFSSLFSATRSFAARYGQIVMIIGTVAYVLSWLYNAYSAGDTYGLDDYNVGRFLSTLFLQAPTVCVEVFILRLIVEVASKIGAPKADGQA
ncbi:hypothetical protein [Actinomyces howellii]|uniref:DUF4282 domain-containing protein n=1 Tax=Actinomyces howellii TaxID=52771 RepID=A0A448HIM4_9ACTO|nr:hypothetical protein [Actinomyces howellii]VEG29387.1 Uncharacterised protein [Actinomyces howellii]